jgi:4-amino-4-deoxy-L-arabinose transferase-like glycosyltransferase
VEVNSVRTEGAPTVRRWWPAAAAALVPALVAAPLVLVLLANEGFPNAYYAAGVRSMLGGLRQTLFVYFDPAGFVSLDKPPLGFALQVVAAALLGFNGTALILPQAIAHILAVALPGWIVARECGTPAGLVAGLALAVAPISVVAARNTTADATLVLWMVLSAGATIRAIQTGRTRWLLLAGALVGLGFLTKMLQVAIIVPALGAAWLVAAQVPVPRRLAGGIAALAVAVVVGGSWVALVELTPADQRPWVGGSPVNSAVDLALGYNGAERLTGVSGPGSGGPGSEYGGQDGGGVLPGPGSRAGSGGGMFGGEVGDPGPLRLLAGPVGDQVGWLLPAALAGAVALAVTAWRRRDRHAPEVIALVLWGGWLVTGFVFFSIAGFWHRYYLAMLGPPIAALVGMGIGAAWREPRDRLVTGIVVAGAVASAALGCAYLTGAPQGWPAEPLVVTVAVLALGGLAGVADSLFRGESGRRAEPIARLGLGLLTAAMLVGPAAWSVDTAVRASGGALPAAGPRLAGAGGVPGGPGPQAIPGAVPGAVAGAVSAGTGVDDRLLDFLERNRGDTRFLLVTRSAQEAAPFIIETGEPVMALHGFGSDPILDEAGFRDRRARGEVRFVLAAGPGSIGRGQPAGAARGGGGPGLNDPVLTWVAENCRDVSSDVWPADGADSGGGGLGSLGRGTLYDCSGA